MRESTQLNTFFKRSEFACKCGCGFETVDIELLEVLLDVRVHFCKPVTMSSVCRCYSHNEAVQKEANKCYQAGTSKSKHMWGIAADIEVKDIEPVKVYDYLNEKYPNKFGIGLYNTFTHIDTRASKARWGNI